MTETFIRSNSYKEKYGDLNKCILSDEDLKLLITTYKETKSEWAKEKILKSHLKMIISIAEQYNAYGTLETEDLINAGVVGFLEALEHYDESKQVKLSYFSYIYIKEKIIKEIEMVSFSFTISSYYKKNKYKYANAVKEFEKEGIEYTDEMLCEELNISPKLLSFVKELSSTRRTDILDMDTEGYSVEKVSCIEDEVYKNNDIKLLLEAFYDNETLTDREFDVLDKTFGITCDVMKLEDLAKKYNVSTARICQIKANALAKLRKKLEPKICG